MGGASRGGGVVLRPLSAPLVRGKVGTTSSSTATADTLDNGKGKLSIGIFKDIHHPLLTPTLTLLRVLTLTLTLTLTGIVEDNESVTFRHGKESIYIRVRVRVRFSGDLTAWEGIHLHLPLPPSLPPFTFLVSTEP